MRYFLERIGSVMLSRNDSTLLKGKKMKQLLYAFTSPSPPAAKKKRIAIYSYIHTD